MAWHLFTGLRTRATRTWSVCFLTRGQTCRPRSVLLSLAHTLTHSNSHSHINTLSLTLTRTAMVRRLWIWLSRMAARGWHGCFLTFSHTPIRFPHGRGHALQCSLRRTTTQGRVAAAMRLQRLRARAGWGRPDAWPLPSTTPQVPNILSIFRTRPCSAQIFPKRRI